MTEPARPLAVVSSHPAPQEPEEYLSIAQLCRRIPYAEQTVRNLMSKGVFKRGEHYSKPRGRIVFRWSAVRAWLEGRP